MQLSKQTVAKVQEGLHLKFVSKKCKNIQKGLAFERTVWQQNEITPFFILIKKKMVFVMKQEAAQTGVFFESQGC